MTVGKAESLANRFDERVYLYQKNVMPTTVQFQTQLTFQQVAQLVRQLPVKDKQKLVKLLEEETSAPPQPGLPDEAGLSASQRKTVANIRQGFKELKLMKEGKLKVQSADSFLSELREEGLL